MQDLDQVRSGIKTDLLAPAEAPTSEDVKVRREDAAAKAKVADELWRKRAFDLSLGFIVILGALGAFLPALDWDKTDNCPAGQESCGTDMKWVGWNDTGSALFWASVVTALLLLLVATIGQGRAKGGIVGLIVGKDNRLSTSKFQMLMWTVALVYAFLFFLGQMKFSGHTSGFSMLNSEYLLLLGGPFAAAVLAIQVAATKASGETVQQVDAAKPGAGDLVQNGSGNADVADTQFLLFNFVALGFFAVALAKTPNLLPDLPDTLVGLTSVSALTYLGAKAVDNNAPTLTAVSLIDSTDGKLHGGGKLRVLGQNFVPLQQPEEELATVVMFDSLEVIPDKVTDKQILVTAPSSLAAGDI